MMEPTWTRVFELGFSRDRVWKAWSDMDEIVKWMEPTATQVGDRVETSTGGDRMETEIVEVSAPDRLRWRYQHEHWPGWVDVTVTFEEATTGTRITLTHAGFGDHGWDDVIDQVQGRLDGWCEAIADLAVYLQTGVATQRHFGPKVDLGVGVVETAGGLVVKRLEPDRPAAASGLEVDDVLVAVNDVGVFKRTDLWAVQRMLAVGRQEATLSYARGDELHTTSCAVAVT